MTTRFFIFITILLLITEGLTAVERKTILFFGDSLTAGYGLDPAQAYPALIQDKIETAGLNFEVVNGGLSGETTAGGLRRIDWMLRRKIDVMVLALGPNDFLRGLGLEQTEENLQGIIDKALEAYPEMKIVIAGMKAPPNLGADYTNAFEDIYIRLAERNDLPLIPFLLENVGGIKELNQADGIHPTAKGNQIMAETVWGVLEEVLQNQSSLSASLR